MPVISPVFSAATAVTSRCRKPEEDLLQAVAATPASPGRRTHEWQRVGGDWEKDHANAILEGWYPVRRAEPRLRETLSGKNNPAGRLPVTFYQDVHQLPNFEDYSMKRAHSIAFEGEPLSVIRVWAQLHDIQLR